MWWLVHDESRCNGFLAVLAVAVAVCFRFAQPPPPPPLPPSNSNTVSCSCACVHMCAQSLRPRMPGEGSPGRNIEVHPRGGPSVPGGGIRPRHRGVRGAGPERGAFGGWVAGWESGWGGVGVVWRGLGWEEGRHTRSGWSHFDSFFPRARLRRVKRPRSLLSVFFVRFLLGDLPLLPVGCVDVGVRLTRTESEYINARRRQKESLLRRVST